jgi:PII-like signaling protein
MTDSEREESETSETEMPDFSQFIDDEDESEGVDLGTILVNALETVDGDTVCSTMVGIRQQLEIHNKIMVKLLKAIGDLKK